MKADIEKLTEQVESLSRQVEKLTSILTEVLSVGMVRIENCSGFIISGENHGNQIVQSGCSLAIGQNHGELTFEDYQKTQTEQR